jgi:BirA family biotin operon repressor/biotin-[acetyl-CoA-carboxylase] ligase
MNQVPAPDSLDAQRILSALGASAPALAVECVPSIESTNAELLQRLPCLDSPLLLAAERQTAGRGRAGRAWLTVPGGSLAFSLAWPFFRREIAGLAGLPLAVGVALAQVLREAGLPVQLKWPNDLLLAGGKLGGVLVETGSVLRADHRQWWAVVGVGINIALPTEAAADLQRQTAEARMFLGRRNDLLAALAVRLTQALARFDQQGLAPFSDAWNDLHAHAGQTVRILDAGQLQIEGVAVGVDERGALLLQTATGLQSVQAGDVSLRASAEAGVS